MVGDAPAARMFDLVMIQAIRERASDIHLEPDEMALRVRFRIDGFLYESLTLPKQIHLSLTSRIKILAEMDIAETRLPQDGNFNVKMEKRSFEIRVSTFPTIYGENVVLRILDQTSSLFKLEDLGFSEEMLDSCKQLMRRPNGIFLVTGPTGTGKTTTLYAFLNLINSREKNIITIEDPVEYRLALIRQTQINPKAGITFATGLRSILRQDPDVVMIGEIRDRETSEIAHQAALTGHLVLSTLHTNDAPEAITRLMDIGVEPYLISSSVIGVLAQRLVRMICPACKSPYPADPNLLSELGEEISKSKEPLTLHRGKGCKNCKQSGYWGRTGIFELLFVNERIKQLIAEKASTQVIREAAKKTIGMISLREDGLREGSERDHHTRRSGSSDLLMLGALPTGRQAQRGSPTSFIFLRNRRGGSPQPPFLHLTLFIFICRGDPLRSPYLNPFVPRIRIFSPIFNQAFSYRVIDDVFSNF